MIQVGAIRGQGIYEPTNAFLKSSEDGLRYCRSMDVRNSFEGPLQLLPWGTPVIGGFFDDSRWMVNPKEMGGNLAAVTSQTTDTLQ